MWRIMGQCFVMCSRLVMVARIVAFMTLVTDDLDV